MSIFSRIGNIIRANLHLGSEPDDNGSGSFYEEYQRKRSEKDQQRSRRYQNPGTSDNSDSGQQRAQANYDPELAQYYANLEVPYGADLETVRRSWKKLLRAYHPDLHSNDPEKQHIANQLVQELNHAYQELAKRLAREK